MLLLLIIFVSLGNIGKIIHEDQKSRRFSTELQKAVITVEKEELEGGADREEPKEEHAKTDIPAEVDFDSLLKVSENAAAWIYCPGTEINNVIAQAEDNEYYLHRLLDGTDAYAGTLFMDYRNKRDLSGWNTVIYGHNMKNGTMFAGLQDYQDQEFYEEHPVMYLYTPGKRYRLELIAGYRTDVNDRIYSIPASEEDKTAILEYACGKSAFVSEVKPGENDRLVTLSTCDYAYDDARYVVIGRLVEE